MPLALDKGGLLFPVITMLVNLLERNKALSTLYDLWKRYTRIYTVSINIEGLEWNGHATHNS